MKKNKEYINWINENKQEIIKRFNKLNKCFSISNFEIEYNGYDKQLEIDNYYVKKLYENHWTFRINAQDTKVIKAMDKKSIRLFVKGVLG